MFDFFDKNVKSSQTKNGLFDKKKWQTGQTNGKHGKQVANNGKQCQTMSNTF